MRTNLQGFDELSLFLPKPFQKTPREAHQREDQ